MYTYNVSLWDSNDKELADILNSMMSQDHAYFEIKAPYDFHLHVRQGAAMQKYVAQTARYFSTALIMPNTVPPIKTPKEVQDYKNEILTAAREVNSEFVALMTFKIQEPAASASYEDLCAYCEALREAGVVAGKLYPQGATTNSEDGVSSLETLYPLFKAMEKIGLLLLVHGEEPSAFSLEREQLFLPKLDQIHQAFPELKIVLEHVSTKEAVNWVKAQNTKVAASVTVHHLLFTLDELLGGSLNPHFFCKPVLKAPQDREAIQEAVLSGDKRFFFGSDSAPHEPEKKEGPCGAAGIYSAPVALPLLLEFFESRKALALLDNFLAQNGREFYGLPLDQSRKTLRFEKKAWKVPDRIDGIVPLGAGSELQWKVAEE